MARTLLILLLCASGLVQAGQFYRWVDARGNVTYSDQPPPKAAKQVTTVKDRRNAVEVDKKSAEATIATGSPSVVLYTSDCGPLCDQARDFLTQRGIPFTEKNPAKEPEAAQELKILTGALEVPVIQIGTAHVKGFEKGLWGKLLDDARHPREPLLPEKSEAIRKP